MIMIIIMSPIIVACVSLELQDHQKSGKPSLFIYLIKVREEEVFKAV